MKSVFVLLGLCALCVYAANDVNIYMAGGGGAAAAPAGSATEAPKGKFKDHVWIVQAERSWKPWSYEDDAGKLTGFHPDLLKAVCAAAGVKCRAVIGEPQWCIEEHQDSGVGIQDKWYDGCMGWSATNHRANSVDYSKAWTTVQDGGFYVRSGETDLITCNGNDCTIKKDAKIGVIAGWSTSPQCLKKHGLLDGHEIVNHGDCGELIPSLKEKKIDVAFYLQSEGHAEAPCLGEISGVEIAGKEHGCLEAGWSVITRPDSEFTEIWNSGLAKVVANGQFQSLCSKWKTAGVAGCCTSWDDATNKCN